MKLKYSDRAINSLEEILGFIKISESVEKSLLIRDKIVQKARTLLKNPMIGQIEPFLEYTGLGYRRLVERNYKIIYRIEGNTIYITDIFDSRQNPEKMQP